MSETRKYSNPASLYTNDPSYYLVDDEGTLREFKRADWNVQITFTRKVKPFPDGSLVFRQTSDEDNDAAYLFHKINGTWHYLFTNDAVDSWSIVDFADDKEMRERPDLYKVLYEPGIR